MKRIIIILLTSLLTVASLFAQATQKGLIQEYNEKSKKTPLAGVELNVRSANSTVSDKDGNFTLQFLTLKPGEKVNIRRIEKLGYEIFNKEAVEQWNINPTTPFVIVMCRSDKFKKIRDNYEKVSSASYARQLKKEEAALAKMKEEGKIKEAEYQQQLFDLRENYEKQLDNLDSYVDRFSRIDLSELSTAEQEIIDLVQEGKIDEAIAKYEEQNYVDKYTQEVAQIKEVSTAIDRLSEVKKSKEASKDSLLAAIDRQIETLKLAGGKENFDKILSIYDRLISSDDLNPKVITSYLDLLNQSEMYEKCIETYNNHIKNLQLPIKYKEKVLVQIGNSFNQLQNLDKAVEYYKEALSILDQLNQTDPIYVTHRRNSILSNMGLAFSRKADFSNALNCFNDCTPIVEDFEGVSSELKRLNNLSILYRNFDFIQAADSVVDLAINLYDSYMPSNNNQKEELDYSLANLYQGKGNIHSDINDFDNAKNSYEKSLDILKSLFEYNPRKYGSSLATIYYNLGRMYKMQEENNDKSIHYYQEALNLYESILNEHFIQRVFDNYSDTFVNLARVYDLLGDTQTCLDLCNRVSEKLELCKNYPYKAATLLSSIGSIYCDLKKYDDSLFYYKKAEDAISTMYTDYPGIYAIHLARLDLNLAGLLCRMKNYNEGKKLFSKSLNLFDNLVSDNSIYLKDRKEALYKGFLFLSLSPEYEESLKYLRELQYLEPDNYKYKENEIIILYGNGEKEKAKNIFLDFINSHPDYPKDTPLYKAMSQYIEKENLE